VVESLKELNKICQKPRYKEEGNWMVRYILRDLALPITWCLLHTGITANQVTLAALLIGLAGNALTASPDSIMFLWGMIFIQFWYLLDHVDGQIARYRKTVSLTGRFFDFLMHHILHGSFFAFAGGAIYISTRNVWFLVTGFVTSFCVISFNLLNDIKAKTFLERIYTLKTLSLKASAQGGSQESKTSLPKKIFSSLHKLLEFHVVMNVYTAAAIAEGLFRVNLRPILFLIYGLTVPLVFITKALFWIRAKKIDQEYNRIFHENDSQ
jgi:phosphatidylglycerophosphate synthase